MKKDNISTDFVGGLNNPQRQAVLTTEGNIMVMAGAGSGKTRVLTHRMAHLIANKNVFIYEILAVTFTNEASKEMKSRIQKLIDIDISQMWVSTFHSICMKILRVEIDYLPYYNSRFKIIDPYEVSSIIREIMHELRVDMKKLKPKEVAASISNKKNLLNYEYKKEHKRIIKKIEDEYSRRLEKYNLIDFDDLILLTIRLFKEKPTILEKYQRRFKYIMIDEFQDTNDSQYELVKLLSGYHNNVFVVGDQDQSIYAFRGAVIQNVDRFLKDYSNTKLILLEENYRSTSSILDLANDVIKVNKDRIDKTVFSNKSKGVMPVCIQLENQYEEAGYVVNKIKELKQRGYQDKDFAIMYRANHLSRLLEEQLLRNHLPFVIYGGVGYYDRAEIKDIIGYLSLVINLDDDSAFLRVVNTPRRRIGNTLLSELKKQASLYNISLFEAIDLVTITNFKYLVQFKDTIYDLRKKILSGPITKSLNLILEIAGYKEYLLSMGDIGRIKLNNVEELRLVLQEADFEYQGNTLEKLRSLLSDMALWVAPDKVAADNHIKLTTCHQSKGLEYKVVFMVGMEEGIFPSSNVVSDYDLEEERRVCYVGITRAEDLLYMTYTKSRFVFGLTKATVISRFIENSRYIEYISSFTEEKDSNELTIKHKVRDIVVHPEFGKGIVVNVKDDRVIVAFEMKHGIKILNPSITLLSKEYI